MSEEIEPTAGEYVPEVERQLAAAEASARPWNDRAAMLRATLSFLADCDPAMTLAAMHEQVTALLAEAEADVAEKEAAVVPLRERVRDLQGYQRIARENAGTQPRTAPRENGQ